jgi:hypothetical protein
MRMESVLSKPGMNDNEIAHRLPLASGHLIMRYFATLLFLLMLNLPAISVELFRYRYQDRDRGEYEAVFETDEQSVGKTVEKEKAEEIVMAWMQVFYSEQIGTIESQELKTKPIPHWLFRLTVDDPVERTYFVVLLANGTVVQPRVAKRL